LASTSRPLAAEMAPSATSATAGMCEFKWKNDEHRPRRRPERGQQVDGEHNHGEEGKRADAHARTV
jgi:hypothetical protein